MCDASRSTGQVVADALCDVGLDTFDGSPWPADSNEVMSIVDALKEAGLLATVPDAATKAQVEAALAAHEAHKGAWVDEFREMVCPECGWCYLTEHERRPGNSPSNDVVSARVEAHRMHATLVAAAGAAPQAEGRSAHEWDPETTPPRMTCGCDSKVVQQVSESDLAGVINDALDAWEGNQPSEVYVASAVAQWLKEQRR